MLALISVSGTALFHNRRLCASLSSGSPRQRLPKVSERANRHHEGSPPKKEEGSKSVGGSRTFQLSPMIYSKVLSASVAEQPAAHSPTDIFGDQRLLPIQPWCASAVRVHQRVCWSLGTCRSCGHLVLFLKEGCKMWMWCLPSLDVLGLGLEASRGYFLELPYLDSRWLLPGRSGAWIVTSGSQKPGLPEEEITETVIRVTFLPNHVCAMGEQGGILLKYLSLIITTF